MNLSCHFFLTPQIWGIKIYERLFLQFCASEIYEPILLQILGINIDELILPHFLVVRSMNVS